MTASPIDGADGVTVGGALPDTAVTVAQIAADADRCAATATRLAHRLEEDVRTLLTTLGGGPPAQLVEANARAASAVTSLEEASSALLEAVDALRTFAGRLT